VIYLASSPEVTKISGRYFVREKAVSPSPASCDEVAAKHLWHRSLVLTGQLASSP